jgi:[ribulose-bisphosphate carboxylase]-lysine N-methyltransferase
LESHQLRDRQQEDEKDIKSAFKKLPRFDESILQNFLGTLHYKIPLFFFCEIIIISPMTASKIRRSKAVWLVFVQVILVAVSTILPTVSSFLSSTTASSRDRIQFHESDLLTCANNNNNNIHSIRNEYNNIHRVSLTTTTTTSLRAISSTEDPSTAYTLSEDEQRRLETLASNFNAALEGCRKDLTRTCNVKVGVSQNLDGDGFAIAENMRLGWIATKDLSKNEILMNMPYDEQWNISPKIARKTVFQGVLDDAYEGWTGDAGLVALQLLNEIARTASGSSGISKPERAPPIQAFIDEWIKALPTPEELKSQHPIFWSEDDQEILQSSSNTKIYQVLDDIDEDAAWLAENVFEKDRTTFPVTVTLNGKETPCFCLDGYKWAMALTNSRASFVDGSLRLLPFMDMCNHDDDARELKGGYMGTFGTTKGAEVLASKKYKAGEEVFLSHGPKSAVDYLLEHGFCPRDCWKTAVSEVTIEIDPDDRFYEDKLDILEFETYDQAPMDPSQSFDVISAIGRDGEPDPAFMQFARLSKVGSMDAFLLESIFRKEVWGFMAFPVSEANELAVVETIVEVCETSLEDLKSSENSNADGQNPNAMICAKLRESESKALKRTLEYMLREKEALDLKEYYQERRLKDLGLDSDWSPEDDNVDPDLSFGQTRKPGGSDFDW